jgi:hypothetical protein
MRGSRIATTTVAADRRMPGRGSERQRAGAEDMRPLFKTRLCPIANHDLIPLGDRAEALAPTSSRQRPRYAYADYLSGLTAAAQERPGQGRREGGDASAQLRA